MLGIVLVPLIIGALISSIWGKEAAQGCFGFIGRTILYGIVAVAVVLVPPIGVVLGLGFAMYLLVRYGGRFVEWHRDTAEEIERERRQAARAKEQEAEDAARRAAADPNALPPGAFGRAQHCRPRPNAPTAMPNPPADAEYTALPVRNGDQSGYALEERRSGRRVFLSVTEYGRDWVACDAPKRKPSPVEQKPKAPAWSEPTGRARRP